MNKCKIFGKIHQTCSNAVLFPNNQPIELTYNFEFHNKGYSYVKEHIFIMRWNARQASEPSFMHSNAVLNYK